MEKCDDKECFLYNIRYENNCEGMDNIKGCRLAKPLKVKEAHLSVSSSAGLEGLQVDGFVVVD